MISYEAYEKDFNKIFSNNLKSLLEQHDMSQLDFAKKLNVSQQSVSYWCTGSKIPRMSKIDEICRVFHCKRSDLMQEHSTSTPPQPATILNDPDINEMLNLYKKLDSIDRVVIKSTANTLLNADKYKKGIGRSST